MLNSMTDSLDFHGKALQLRAIRQGMLASNIANADTPGYIAKDLNFAEALRAARVQQPLGASPSRSGSDHVGVARPGLGGLSTMASTQTLFAAAAQHSVDQNTVDMDRERASFADNAAKYEATLRFINSNVRTMLEAIKGQA